MDSSTLAFLAARALKVSSSRAVVRGQAQDQWEEEEEEAKEDDAKDEASEEQMVGSRAWWLWVSVQLQSMMSPTW